MQLRTFEIRSGVTKLGSWYFIIPCVALAMLALSAAAYGVGLRSASVVPKSDPVSPPRVGVSQSTTRSLIPPYTSPAEKERIVDTMNFIRDRFNNVGYPIMADADAAFNAVSPVIALGKLESLAEKMKSALTAADALGRDIDKIRNESQNYAMDFAFLLRAKPVYLETFREALGDFANALSVYRGLSPTAGSYSDPLIKMLIASGRNLSRAKHGFEQWMQECEEEMRKARTELSK